MESLRLADLLGSMQKILGMSEVAVRFQPFHPEYRKCLNSIGLDMVALRIVCQQLQLVVTEVEIEEFFKELRAVEKASKDGPNGECAYLLDENTLPKMIHQVLNTLRKEASVRAYFHLPHASRLLYANPAPFGEDVKRAFPAAIMDVEEAARCLAFSRATASVFHSMRAVEFGLRKIITESFGDPAFFADVSTWGAIQGRLRREANKPDGTIAPSWNGKQDRLTKLAFLVQQFADAFRNPTMHCAPLYTVDQAKDVFQAAGAFLRRLAEDIERPQT